LLVIGLGAGNPDYVTIQAINALNEADVFFVFDKGEAKDDLVRFRRDVCERFIKDRAYRFVSIIDPVRDPAPAGYERGVLDWHRERARRLSVQIAAEVPDDGYGAFLVWGDPSLYDSTLRLIEIMRTEGGLAFDLDVIPGITSVQALAASHKLVLNAIGGAVHITTGRDLAENGLPDNADSVVVMLDRGDGLRAMRDEDVEIHWGAYLGTPDEILVSGKARDVVDEIEAIRARERERHGWIMDTYLLRRLPPD
jgi:precorrin-6A synthase